MESSGSRKVKCRWDSLPDVSPNKYIKYNEGSEPRCSVGNSQDERCVSGSNSLLKTCEEKQTALDLTNAFVEGKSGMQIETCAHPRNIARSVVTTKAWNLKRAVAPPRRILFHKPQYHSQPTQPVPYRSVPSFSESTAQEPDLSEGSDFSDVDDVIPFAKLSQDEFIQANNIEKEAVTPIMYPQPLIRNSWSDYTRYGTSTPVRAQSTTRSLLNGASFKNVFSRNSTSNASPSYNYSALSEGSCCGANSISDSWISEDKSKSFIEEPSFHISEAHSPDHLLQESEMKESPATLPRWMSEGFIDTHCHLDMLYAKLSYTGSFAKFRQVYSSTFSKQFQGCIADFCNPRATKKFPWEDILRDDMVWGAFGCHPHFARFYNEFHERELLQAMRHPKTIAFGEMGLDYSHKCTTEVSVQHKVFERQLQLAVGLRKPLVIHCRDADEDLLEIMKKAVPRDYKIHRHCFTGSFKVIEPFLEAFPNMAVGFTAVLTYPSANDVKDAVKKIPLERIIVETDAPYFLPRQVHKRVCQFAHPGHAIHTVNEIARIKELPPTSVMAVVRQNTNQLYNL
ncbi:putative deoxyribonuclease TATDN2 isoform X2 [Ambystoma mexicanum]|uniref:putative deoxyribonuclease TATDN2 isoform X2 n=1 Tax=Ambystoma mexicanum TaxID=8296 RepID=UPI0037E8E225